MGDPAATQSMTPAEFLAWEDLQKEKHEYHRGDVFAMAGGSPRHNFLAASAVAELRTASRTCGCHALNSDQRIAAGSDRFVYADAVVVCGAFELAPETTDVLANPAIVVEVLSPSTEAYDRGAKWQAYRQIPSLRDYLLVSQDQIHVEHFQRGQDGAWSYRVLIAGDTARLANGVSLAVDAIYEGAFDLPAAS